MSKYGDSFLKIDQKMKEDVNYKWDDFVRKFVDISGIKTNSEDETDIKNANDVLVAFRNGVKNTANIKARTHKKTWRLYVSKNGETIFKASTKHMVTMEMLRRMKRVASSESLISKNMFPMLGYNVSGRDKITIRGLIDLQKVVTQVHINAINSLDSISKMEKATILQYLEYKPTKEEKMYYNNEKANA